jgi:hypothetical protein
MTTPAFSQTFAFDAGTGFVKRAAGSAALTSDGYVGTQLDQGSAAITDMVLVLNVESVDIAGTDEIYNFRIVLSNVADRSDGVVVATAELGHITAIPGPETVSTAAGDRHVLYFRTEKDGVAYRYVDLHLDVTGATCSIAFGAYLSKVI